MKTFIGPRLRRLRIEHGQTQVQMAKELGISTSYVNLLEKNERSVSVPVLLKLFEAYGVDWRDIAEDDDTVKAAIFPEGHYFMVELVGKVAGTDNPELADQFMEFILSEEFQSMIATGNWSFPAALPQDQWPEGFQALDLPEKVLFYSEDEADALKDQAIEAWRAGLSQ